MNGQPRLTQAQYLAKLRVILAAQRRRPDQAIYWQGQRNRLDAQWKQQERRAS